jgi:hypothetical protein
LCVFSPFRTGPAQPPSPPPVSSGLIPTQAGHEGAAGIFPAGMTGSPVSIFHNAGATCA